MSKILILSAPSGSGKTTICNHLLQQDFKLEFSISACNRESRKGEVHGQHYYFLTTQEFQEKVQANEFLEWEEVYQGRYYGTLRSEVERIWAKGNNVLFDVDVLGGLNLKKQFGDKALALFIQPPSVEALMQRLQSRSTDSAEEIQRRVDKAAEELTYASKFDSILVNDDLDKALIEGREIVSNFLQA